MGCINKRKFKNIDNEQVWFVYKLLFDKKFYIGIASNIPRMIREQEHNPILNKDFTLQIYAYFDSKTTCNIIYNHLVKKHSKNKNCLNFFVKDALGVK